MPHIRMRGIDKNKLLRVSEALIADVSQISGAPESHFTLELIATEFIAGGQVQVGEAFCEVLWFDRPQAVQDQVAQAITQHLKKLEPNQDVVVVFTGLEKNKYYENGLHF